MLKVRDIMTTDVVTVTPHTTLRDAIELFAKRHVSGAPVIDGERVVGVVSTSDVLGFEASNPGVPSARDEVEWADVEEETPETDDIDPEDEPTAEFFTERWDDAGADVSERMSELASPEWDILEEHEVEEIMTRKLLAVPPEAPVEEAARLMKERGVHRVFVTQDRKIVGVVSAIDIAHAVAEHLLDRKTYVFNREGEFGAA
jgi:CBS domain-containing protein